MKRPDLTPKRLNHYTYASQSAGPSDEFVHWRDTHYTGAELKPFTGRPGAMDAYKLPSLQGSDRHAD